MKKLFVFAIALVVSAFLFSSCQKEGQYLPKKKITQIEHTNTYTDFLGIEHTTRDKQEWNWNGKFLNNIVFYDAQGNRTDAIFFHYDSKKRFNEIANNSGSFIFYYDDKNLEKIEHYLSGDRELADEYFFTKEDKSVVEVKHIVYKTFKEADITPLQFILPENAVEVIAQTPATKGHTHTYKLSWTDNNLTDMTEEHEGITYRVYNWKYDNNINPFKGLFSAMESADFSALYSANNVIEETCTSYILTPATNVTKYQYVYDGKMPIHVEWTGDLTIEHHTRTFTY